MGQDHQFLNQQFLNAPLASCCNVSHRACPLPSASALCLPLLATQATACDRCVPTGRSDTRPTSTAAWRVCCGRSHPQSKGTCGDATCAVRPKPLAQAAMWTCGRLPLPVLRLRARHRPTPARCVVDPMSDVRCKILRRRVLRPPQAHGGLPLGPSRSTGRRPGHPSKRRGHPGCRRSPRCRRLGPTCSSSKRPAAAATRRAAATVPAVYPQQ